MTRLSLGEVALNVEEAGAGRPLLLLHGFTGSARTWEPFLPAWSATRRAIAVDLLGHGGSDSPADPERYTMPRCVAVLVAVLDRFGLERADVLGYSMGGRVALHLAAAHPERIGALVLESASPGLETAAERAQRVRADEELAERIEREGLERFVDEWQDIPLFASQRSLPADTRERLRRERLANDPRGLANSLRGLGAGRQEPLWDRLSSLAMPIRLVVGERDARYVEIGRRMASAARDARLEVVAGAGHAVHLERPDAFERLVTELLAQHR